MFRRHGRTATFMHQNRMTECIHSMQYKRSTLQRTRDACFQAASLSANEKPELARFNLSGQSRQFVPSMVYISISGWQIYWTSLCTLGQAVLVPTLSVPFCKTHLWIGAGHMWSHKTPMVFPLLVPGSFCWKARHLCLQELCQSEITTTIRVCVERLKRETKDVKKPLNETKGRNSCCYARTSPMFSPLSVMAAHIFGNSPWLLVRFLVVVLANKLQVFLCGSE